MEVFSQWNLEKRFDSIGKKHYNNYFDKWIETPHVHEQNYPGGIRSAYDWEIPK